MRAPILLLLMAAVTASVPSSAQQALPAGGRDYFRPGFMVHAPAAPWMYQQTGDSRDNSSKGSFQLEFGRPVGGFSALGGFVKKLSGSTAALDVVATVLPYAGRDRASLREFLMQYGHRLEAEEIADASRRHYISHRLTETSLNGALCISREAVVEDVGVPRHEGEAFTLTIHGLLCSHPEFPAYIIRDEYSMRLAPGEKLPDDAEGLAARDSLKFRPLGYHVSFIPLGELPQVAAEADGAIWATYGYQQGKVGRIDPKANSVTAVVAVGRNPIGIAGYGGSLWVANSEDNSVSRIDPSTNKVTATIAVGAKPQFIVGHSGAVWVTLNGAGKVARIDPATGAVTEIGGVGEHPAGLAAMDGTIYVSDYGSGTISCIDPATNTVKGVLKGGPSSNFLLADKPYVWVNSQTKQPAVLRFDPSKPESAAVRYGEVDYEPSGMAKWNGKLFVPNWVGASVSQIDPDNSSAQAILLPAGEAPIFALSAQGSLWVVVSGAGRATLAYGILRFDAQ
ncbi:MAG: YncE family protein [Rhizomicrobium sp.]|nr:YncE family protein [Rhizomicrobium sp.]